MTDTTPPSDVTAIWDRRKDDDVATPVLRVVAGIDVVRFQTVRPGADVLIGRDEDACHLALSDHAVSRKHARVWADGTGIWIEDLGSMNGTRCDGRAVTERTPLRPGSLIKVGGMTIRLDIATVEELHTLDRLERRVSEAQSDVLTGLRTRRAFTDEAAPVARRHHLRGAPVSAIFLDIDRFKWINDTFGHRVGDEVLRVVARLLRQTVRKTDYAIRWGGEEFVLVLPGCNVTDAEIIARRVCGRVRDYEWGAVSSLGTPERLVVTISAGVAALADGMDDWIERADRAMYASKQLGRDRVTVART
jgi:diguanylate cyclase (GGDEF)-like protein